MPACSHQMLFFLILLALPSSNGMRNTGTSEVGVGAILNYNSRAGKEGKIAIEMAMDDFYSHFFSGPLLHLRNSQGDPLQAVSTAKNLINKHEVRAIIGMETWEEVAFTAELGNNSQVPILSLTMEVPIWASKRLAFLVNVARSQNSQMRAVAGIVQSWGWRRVAVIYEDVTLAIAGIFPHLIEALREIDSEIEVLLPIPSFPSGNSLIESLEKLKRSQCRVFIVHTSLDLASNIFMEAKNLGMVDKGFVWIATTRITNQIDYLNSSMISSMQGLIGIKSYFSHTGKSYQEFHSRFRTLFNKSYPNESNLEPGICALQAYDGAWALAQAMYGNTNRKVKENLKDNFPIFSKSGKWLLGRILQSTFKGLTGDFSFVDGDLVPANIFRVINVVGKSNRELGFWSEGLGFSEGIAKRSNYNKSMTIMGNIFWPGGPWFAPRGWTAPTSATPLRIGVPADSTFTDFVNVVDDGFGNEPNVHGFSMDVFKAVRELLPYDLPCQFIAFKGTYDSLIETVHNGTFDAVVGDTSILSYRFKYAEFSQPYSEPGLRILVYENRRRLQRAWLFKKPFTTLMWISTGVVNLYNGFVVLVIERNHNQHLRGSVLNEIGTMIWLAFTTLFRSNGDNLHSNLSRIAMVVWLFVALVITSSYIASLTSLLTLRQLDQANINVETLKSSNAKVGCDANSYIGEYLEVVLGFNPNNIKKIYTSEEYHRALVREEIAAAFLEIPYVKVFLARHCVGFSTLSQTFKVGGFGFVFPRGSPVLPDISEAIIKVSESGKLRELENSMLAFYNCSAPEDDDDRNTLGLPSFWGLFVITVGTSTISLLLFTFRRYWPSSESNQEHQPQHDPSEDEIYMFAGEMQHQNHRN